VEQPGSSQGS